MKLITRCNGYKLVTEKDVITVYAVDGSECFKCEKLDDAVDYAMNH